MHSFDRRFLPLSLIAAAALWTSVASATIMTELSIEDLTVEADAIVYGVVERSHVRVRLEHRETHGREAIPETVTTVRVYEWIKGAEQNPRATIVEPFGEWEGGGQQAAGLPSYRPNEEVILFLSRNGSSYRTSNLVQGKFAVRRGVRGVPSTVGRDLSEISLVRWTRGRMAISHGTHGPQTELEVFLDYLRRIVAPVATTLPESAHAEEGAQ